MTYIHMGKFLTWELFILCKLHQLTIMAHLAETVFTPSLNEVFPSQLTRLEVVSLYNLQN